ncbi:hypothetical protein EB796_018714 [Bugula neritina]|uniref:Uncharacterized protein n=1 Tax=Bugula neritina TaxID=10212 RepID=A0A7J7JAH2_BUGNE|nr:hypothetical protein EB796_018714 [Bugula neritina]
MTFDTVVNFINAPITLPPPRVQVKLPTEETEYSADGEIYEAISHVDYEINGKTLKPMPPAMHSFQKSTMISSKPPADWGSDEYEDPENTQKIGQIPRSASLTQSSNNTYAMYQDPSLNAQQHASYVSSQQWYLQ